MEGTSLIKAQPPFDNRHADFILQTKDDFIFYVFKVILAQASPVFADMLSVPHPPPEMAQEGDYIDGIPVVRVDESSHTTDAFLRCCYPIVNPILDMSDIHDLYKAGHKYDADVVVDVASQRLSHFLSNDDTCLRAYAVACRLELPDAALRAAVHTLRLSLDTIMETKFGELDLISGSAVINLWSYHRKCQETIVVELLDPTFWLKEVWARQDEPLFERVKRPNICCEEDPKIFEGTYEEYYADGAPYVEHEAEYRAKRWMAGFIADLRQNVTDSMFSIRDAITDINAMDRALEKANNCDNCRKNAFSSLRRYTETIESFVTEEILSVSIHALHPAWYLSNLL